VQAGVTGTAAALRSVLNDHAVFLLSLDTDATLGDIMAHGFFYIDMLSGLG
jgi:hypothetical protein